MTGIETSEKMVGVKLFHAPISTNNVRGVLKTSAQEALTGTDICPYLKVLHSIRIGFIG
jgi:hypothetical protein